MNADDIFNDVMSEQKGQRGKKQCPDCDSLVGVRTYKCKCGYPFVEKKTKREQKKEVDLATDEERLYAMCIGAPGGRLVYAARGCPSASLVELTKESVFDYCNLVVHEGIQEGCIYTVQAIKGYIKHQYGYNSEEYKSACEFVDLWETEKMGVDIPSSCCTMDEDGDDPWA